MWWPGSGRSMQRHARRTTLSILAGLLVLIGQASTAHALGIPAPGGTPQTSRTATPNRFNPGSAATSILHLPKAGTATSKAGTLPYTPPRKISVQMKYGRVQVDPVV